MSCVWAEGVEGGGWGMGLPFHENFKFGWGMEGVRQNMGHTCRSLGCVRGWHVAWQSPNAIGLCGGGRTAGTRQEQGMERLFSKALGQTARARARGKPVRALYFI